MKDAADQRPLKVPPGAVAADQIVRGAQLDPLQTSLRRLFGKFTGVADVGLDDNFFELGGNSMSGMRLILELSRGVGKSVELGLLFRAPTVAALAKALVDDEHIPRWNSLIPLHTEAAGTPIFFAHWIPRRLAYRLGQKYPVYALHSGLMRKKTLPPLAPPTSVEALSTEYIYEMRLIQTTGPYRLVGASFGGLVAYEMACQLVEQGEQVELLCLVDTKDPTAYSPPPLPLKEQFHNLLAAEPSVPVRYLTRTKRSIYDIFAGFERAKSGPFLGKAPVSIESLKVIGRKYQPRPYRGKLEFFKGSTRDSPIRFASSLPIESKWMHLALGGIRVHTIPGDHQTMLGEPGAGQIATIVDACLAKEKTDRL